MGEISVGQMAALIRGAAAFLGIVSGPMHVADCLGIPSAVLFGSEHPDWGGPRFTRSVCIQSPTQCRPACCYPCHQPYFCIDDIPVAIVIREVAALLEDPRHGLGGLRLDLGASRDRTGLVPGAS
jgi:ADP-heptose:LPS heptosyltransferase